MKLFAFSMHIPVTRRYGSKNSTSFRHSYNQTANIYNFSLRHIISRYVEAMSPRLSCTGPVFVKLFVSSNSTCGETKDPSNTKRFAHSCNRPALNELYYAIQSGPGTPPPRHRGSHRARNLFRKLFASSTHMCREKNGP